MQPDLNSLQTILRTRRAELSRDYAVTAIGIFGSYARGSATDQSGLDIVVEFDRPIGFFKFLELEERLGEWLGVKVDLVTKAALKPRIGRRILSEAVMI